MDVISLQKILLVGLVTTLNHIQNLLLVDQIQLLIVYHVLQVHKKWPELHRLIILDSFFHKRQHFDMEVKFLETPVHVVNGPRVTSFDDCTQHLAVDSRFIKKSLHLMQVVDVEVSFLLLLVFRILHEDPVQNQ